MVKKEYDIIFLTNTPSFYKLNLCNQISRKCKLLVVFIGMDSAAVNRSINSNDNFDNIFLFNGDINQRSKLSVFIKLFFLLRSIVYKKIIFEGWYIPEFNLLSLFTAKKNNCIINESTLYESSFKGLKGLVKKIIINRMSYALPSGTLHQNLFEEISFKGKYSVTYGVGIFNKSERIKKKLLPVDSFKYLLVARLIEVKNIEFLIDRFNENGKSLTIVGTGHLEEFLEKRAKTNIKFEGFVENEKLNLIYSQHDVFILPSRSEPWGLVIDEALYFGLPVIVSDRVGCSIDLIVKPATGVVFELDNQISFRKALNDIEKNYQYYKHNVDNVDFEKRDEAQINAYLSILD